MKPLINITIVADSARDSAGIARNILASAAARTTKNPTNKNPPRKLKSRRVVRAYPDSPRKITPVPPRAVATVWGPFGRDRYRVRIGPRAKPSNPVIAKTTPIPDVEFAVLGKTNHIRAKAAPMKAN